MLRRSLLLGGSAVAASSRALAQPMPLVAPVGRRRLGAGPLWSLNAGPPGVTLDLNFMTMGGTLDPRVTFTRASTATYFDNTGAMQTAATNVARFDYNPSTLQLNGLLIEEARTNLLLNSATLSTQSVTTTAVATTLSFYGTGSITRSGTSSGTTNGTGATTRTSVTFTPTAGTLTLTVSGSVTNAQVEAGAFVTSYIPTAGASATRAADTATIASIPGRNTSGESFQAEFLLITSQETNPRIIGSASTTHAPILTTNATRVGAINDAATSAATANSFTFGTVAKIGTSWALPSNGRACLNAGAIGTSAGLTNGFASDTSLKLMGDAVATDTANGYIRRFRYWPRVLTDAELQQVTT